MSGAPSTYRLAPFRQPEVAATSLPHNAVILGPRRLARAGLCPEPEPLGCPGSDRYETGRLRKGKGSPKLRVANQPTSGDPHAGFWPAAADYRERSSGVAPSRREDPRYRSGEKARRRRTMAPGYGG